MGWRAVIASIANITHSRRMRGSVKLAKLVGSLTLLSGCGGSEIKPDDQPAQSVKGEYLTDCVEVEEPFKNQADGIDHHAIVFVATLAADGRLSLNGDLTSLPEMLSTLEKVSQFRPPPYLILEIESSASCEAVTNFRSALASTELCQGGYCSEGQNWREWPIKIAPNTFVAPP